MVDQPLLEGNYKTIGILKHCCGTRCSDEIKAMTRQLNVLFVSGYASEEGRRRRPSVINQPVSPIEPLMKVREMLQE